MNIRHDIQFSMTIESFEDEDFRVLEFSTIEAISTVYNTTIKFASENAFLSLQDIIDRKVSLHVEHREDGERWFHGVVESIQSEDSSNKWHKYEIVIKPALHRLDYRKNCRIFQQKDVITITEELFKEHKLVDYNWAIYEKHLSREYCVQYRETDLQFFHRIMAEEGISYYFSHEKDRHILYLTDATITNQPLPDKESIEYNANPGGYRKDPFIRSFNYSNSLKPTSYKNNDRSFRSPKYSLIHSSQNVDAKGKYDYEIYDYPGRFKEDVQGKTFTKFWMESEVYDQSKGKGVSDCIHFCPGYRINMQNHENDVLNQQYLLTEVEYEGQQHQSIEESASEEPANLDCTFHCIPARTPYRPQQRTLPPKVDGPQLATVVGPAGEEIFCDEYARIKVQFPWDRYGKNDEHSSCWIRVSNITAGQGWGQVFLPRIGQEVIVDFMEGDPDQPVITGRTYHAGNMPPYKLPDNMTRSTIKSKTHKGQGSNEMRFEDQVGQEEFYQHAQKDMNTKVLNNQSNSVNVDRTKSIGNNETSSIGNDRTESVGNNEKISIGVDRNEDVGNDENVSIGSNQSLSVGSEQSIDVGSSRTKSVGSNETVTIGMNKVETIAIGSMENVGAAKALSIGGAYQTSVGALMNTSVGFNQTAQIGRNKSTTVSKKLKYDAGDEIELVTGKSSILMKKDGTIVISGKEITINASANILEKATNNIVLKANKIKEN